MSKTLHSSNFGGLAFSANQSFLKGFQIALIGWKKAGPQKRPLFGQKNRLKVSESENIDNSDYKPNECIRDAPFDVSTSH